MSQPTCEDGVFWLEEASKRGLSSETPDRARTGLHRHLDTQTMLEWLESFAEIQATSPLSQQTRPSSQPTAAATKNLATMVPALDFAEVATEVPGLE